MIDESIFLQILTYSFKLEKISHLVSIMEISGLLIFNQYQTIFFSMI